MCFDTEEADVWTKTRRIARKVHKCYECGHDIVRGQRYDAISCFFDGHWDRWSTCLDCVSLREAVIVHEESEGCHGIEAVPPSGCLWVCADYAGVASFWRPKLSSNEQ